ncbi:hypothetical protein ISCGN_021373 [Ixodes scapularis]
MLLVDFTPGGYRQLNGNALTCTVCSAKCSFAGLTDLDIGSQFFIIENTFAQTLTQIGLGFIPKAIYGLCHGIFKSFDCSRLYIDDKYLCEDEIVLNWPSALGIGQCIDQEAEACPNGTATSENIIVGGFKWTACALRNAADKSQGPLGERLVCSMANVILKMVGSKNPIFRPFTSIIQNFLGSRC